MSSNTQPHYIAPWMFRVPGEHVALVFSFIVVGLIAWIFSLLDFWVLVLLVCASIVYVQLQQAQYKGNAVRVTETQFPHLHALASKNANALRMHSFSLFISQSPDLQAYTLGITHCTIILTSALVEQFNEKELDFVISHELGHYKAGHTKLTTLINPLGNGNFLSNYIFAFWNRKTEYSCDRCAIILTKDLDSALSALIKLSIGGKLFSQIDKRAYVQQLINAQEKSVRTSELLLDHPLITNRIRYLYMFWKENFTQQEKI